MKRIRYYFVFVATLFAVASCVEPLDSFIPGQEQDFILSFSCGAMTKGDDDPTTANNYENLIKKIDYFIFPVNAEGKVEDNTPYAVKGTITTDPNNPNSGFALTYTKKLSHEDLIKCFPNSNTTAVVFAVANYVNKFGANPSLTPSTTIPEDADTWAELHALEVGATFFYDDGKLNEDGTPKFGLRWPRKMNPDNANLFFVMTGEKEIALKPTPTTDNPNPNLIPLKRLASKVTVKFNYAESVVDNMGTPNNTSDDITWIPQADADETRVFLSNAIEHTTLGGPLTRDLVGDDYPTATQPMGNGSRDIFEYAYDFLKTDVTTTDDQGKKVAHYYTYPFHMKDNNQNLGDDNQPYLKLVLPWYGYKNRGTDENNQIIWEKVKQKEVYYKIILPSGSIDESNKLYEYVVDVSIVNNDKDVSILGDYMVKDWPADGQISTTNVATGRYISLDIPKDEYDMYSELSEIVFVSSGEVVISDLQIYQDDFSSFNSTQIDFITGKNGETYSYGPGMGADTEDIVHNKLPNWVTIEGTKLVVRHQMNNDFTDSSFDAAPMTFIVTLHLKDAGTDITFDRTVTITQYPALYVTKDEHFGHVFVNHYGTTSNVSAWDNNGDHGTSQSAANSYRSYFLGNVLAQDAEFSGGSNQNPNNYNIYVSALTNNTKGWVISDPRDEAGTIERIDVTQYRKTRSDASNIIAPAFKIASSYGMCVWIGNQYQGYGNPTFQNAIKRCASYQENGYPAGRWRVPTEAEIEFCILLSDNRKIPSLFDAAYFASSGRYYDQERSSFVDGTNYAVPVRCVYDVWYWGEEKSEACYSGTDAEGNKLYNTWGGFQD